MQLRRSIVFTVAVVVEGVAVGDLAVDAADGEVHLHAESLADGRLLLRRQAYRCINRIAKPECLQGQMACQSPYNGK